ncbi:MAG: ATP-binding protein [Thermodesulfobacteriota bacterium]
MSDNLQRYRLLQSFLPPPSQRRLLLLTGARQTGKTTLVKASYPDLRYINLDAPENREMLAGLPTAAWGRDVGNAIIDEAQKEPVVFEKTKYAWDEGSIAFGALLGSSQILLLERIRESLAGRITLFELWPLLMRELRLPGEEQAPCGPPLLDQLLEGVPAGTVLADLPSVTMGREMLAAWEAEEHLLRWGGMPALLPLAAADRWQWLRDYEHTYLERDLGDLARLRDLAPFRKLQRLAALRSASLLNYSELARDAAIGVDSSRRYLEYLRLSYQVVLIQPFHENLTSALVKTPKLYWLDLGLLRSLSGQLEGLTGSLYETMVVGEILKWVRTARKRAELFFYRTRSGLEVDLLVEQPSGILAVEVKGRAVVTATDVRPMQELAARLGRRWLGGLVVYRGKSLQQVAAPDIWAMPSHRLLG